MRCPQAWTATTFEEVLYRLGNPVFVAAEMEPGAQWRRIFYTDRDKDVINALPAGTTITQYPQWSYEGVGADHLDLDFDATGALARIQCFDHRPSAGDYCRPLLRIRPGMAEARVREILGAPSTSELDDGVKTLSYSPIRIRLLLVKQRVYSVGLEPSQGFSWRGFLGYWMHS